MYEIFFYVDQSGREPVSEYMEALAARADKSSRIKLQKINDYLEFLHKNGKRAGEPYVKHLDGEIWELRPIKDRILFAAWDGKGFILLRHFVKKTRKTPRQEIDKAKKLYTDFIERSGQDGPHKPYRTFMGRAAEDVLNPGRDRREPFARG
jgi:phage-related protein